ncbi:MAG: A/G-specific adenine glycosylase [Nannocystaceae bacterium]|nr:A/G-specific adenine glycosylase [Nannocystaceae bacterium]
MVRRTAKRAPGKDAVVASSIPDAVAIAGALGPWFERGHRDLPWRATSDPYAVWVSEVMLQQTQVQTVQRYWGEFLRRFPTVQRLAAADQSEVLEAWSGLGYYRRARLLHRGAQFVTEEYGGQLPDDPQALLAVPGIGRYTAGAVASIAFDRPAPLVDGNVARVMSRLDAVEDPARQPATAARHWPRVADIIAAGRPRILAQALMELGATVCTPRSPKCEVCPVRPQCLAHAQGQVDVIPSPKKRAASPKASFWALAIMWRGRLGLVRRPDEGLLAGMFCLPLVARDSMATADNSALSACLGVPVTRAAVTETSVKHVFTHRVWLLQPVLATARRKPASLPGGEALWVEAGERPRGGMPTVTEKLLAAL